MTIYKIGVLSLQGDFLEHIQLLKEIENVKPVIVKKSEDLLDIDALIIPGGESTTIGDMIFYKKLDEPIRNFAREGKPILGTCAGAILLAKKVSDKVVGETNQRTLELMKITVLRNVFGRQKDSFIINVETKIGKLKAAFIRAPGIIDAQPPAEIIGYIDHPATGKIGILAIQDNLIAATFHPEITGEKILYQYIITLIKK
ncbi:MAG: pyridoxal 5'-phosphate synthase glutaminase subunit PdxT [Thermoproteota archaeon]|jgi:5'-phosphate synthase pdxT subunit|nr:pyridoxal 5'-phosphate synthase glutaminase subunit PdxT [Thermoproteota archaeon]